MNHFLSQAAIIDESQGNHAAGHHVQRPSLQAAIPHPTGHIGNDVFHCRPEASLRPVITVKTPVLPLTTATTAHFYLSHLSITHFFLVAPGQPGQHLLSPCTHSSEGQVGMGIVGVQAIVGLGGLCHPSRLILLRICIGNHSCCELIINTAVLPVCKTNTTFSRFFKTSSFLFPMFSAPCLEKVV